VKRISLGFTLLCPVEFRVADLLWRIQLGLDVTFVTLLRRIQLGLNFYPLSAFLAFLASSTLRLHSLRNDFCNPLTGMIVQLGKENNEDSKMVLIERVIDWLPHTSFQLISFY
jgi:hypothetical protein